MDATAQAVAALREAAREHKRATGYHRRQARELMQQAAAIEEAAALGIDIHHSPKVLPR